jgi:hypothetical protein
MITQQTPEAGRSAGKRQRSWPAAQSQGGERNVQRRDVRQGNGRQSDGSNTIDQVRLACGLGWFSIGLGLAEVAASRAIARLVRVPATIVY